MSAWSVVSSVFKPAAELIDNVHTSSEEKLKLKNALVSIETEFKESVLTYENELLKNKADIIRSESTGIGALQRSWRPITMLTFLFLVVCDSFGWLANPLAPQAWELLKLGIGGYVVGRSAEKLMNKFKG